MSIIESNLIEVNGYCYPNIDIETLKATLPYLTYLSIFSYHITAKGDLISITDKELIRLAKGYLVAPMLVVTNIDEEGSFNSDLIHSILVNNETQNHFLNEAVNIMTEKGYYGISIDFEYIYPSDRENYNIFLTKASTFFHQNGFVVTTALAPKTSNNQQGTLYEAHDYGFHGKTVDHVILMTYEWGYTYGPPQAVAPLNQVRKVINYAITEIPNYKILMGIPNYGYDWTIPYQQGIPARSLSLTQANDLAIEKNVPILFDTESQSPYFYYNDSKGNEHIVWFEDKRSIRAKFDLVKEYTLSGISIWTINSFTKMIFEVLDTMFYVKKLLE